MPEMLKEVSSLHSEMKAAARGAEPELPAGAAPVAEPPVEEPEVVAEAAVVEEPPAAEPPPKAESETLIRIGSQIFKTQAEAIAYAERLEEEKLVSEAYQSGIRDAIQSQVPAAPPPAEDNFEEEFYSNPKATLAKVREQAKNDALAAVDADRKKESLWRTFEERYPDIERRDAELILAQNMDTVGKMTDVDKAMEVLARKTRAEYQRIVERYKPRTELPQSRGQATVPSSAGAKGVTPAKKEEPVLTMAQQMKNLREQKRSPA